MTQSLNRMRQNEKNRHKNCPCKRALTLVNQLACNGAIFVNEECI